MRKANAALLVGLCLTLPAAATDVQYDRKASRPAWSELTSRQRAILAPLRAEWDRMDDTRRREWVRIARRYPEMSAVQQQRLQQRMSEWAGLSAQERSAAREKYRKLEQLPPAKRREIAGEWTRYQRFLAQQESRRENPAAGAFADQSAEPASPTSRVEAE